LASLAEINQTGRETERKDFRLHGEKIFEGDRVKLD